MAGRKPAKAWGGAGMYKILIVDDEENIRNGIARGIPWAEWGFEVIGQAENGEEAVSIIEKEKPQVVLSDIRMPKMDGIELMQYLHEKKPEVKIIILSGYNDVEYLSMAIKNQVSEYLLKPTDIDEFEILFHRLKSVLDEEQSKRDKLEAMKESLLEKQELSYASLLNNLLNGYVGGEKEYRWKQELEEQGMNFSSCILVVLDTGESASEDKDGHYKIKQRIIRYCNARESAWPRLFYLHGNRQVVGLITISDAGEGYHQAVSYVQEIQTEIGDIYGLALLAGISPICTGETLLPDCYEKAASTVASSAPDILANQNKSSILVSAIKEYIDQQYDSNRISLEEVAGQFRKNPAYISKVFKKETGFNFSDYITQKRMARSKILLKDMSLKIYEIAQMTGYADVSNFIRVFKKHCGMSPNEFRSFIGM